jgi:hypothetical protein
MDNPTRLDRQRRFKPEVEESARATYLSGVQTGSIAA